MPQPAALVKPPIDDKLMMCPERWLRSVGSTARITLRLPNTLAS